MREKTQPATFDGKVIDVVTYLPIEEYDDSILLDSEPTVDLTKVLEKTLEFKIGNKDENTTDE